MLPRTVAVSVSSLHVSKLHFPQFVTFLTCTDGAHTFVVIACMHAHTISVPLSQTMSVGRVDFIGCCRYNISKINAGIRHCVVKRTAFSENHDSMLNN